MINIFTLILEANESREVAASGEYFELRNAVSTVMLIELLDRTGGVISRLVSPEQSDYVRPGLFETVRITNGATAQTVRYFYGTGDAGSRRFSGNISGTVDLSAATLAALESVDLNAATVNSLKLSTPRSEAHTTNGATQVLLASNLNDTICTPAANVNGLVMQSFYAIHQTTTGNVLGSLLAKAGAVPANWSDGAMLCPMYQAANIGGATQYYKCELIRDIFVPAGFGVYFNQSEGTNANGARQWRYRLL